MMSEKQFTVGDRVKFCDPENVIPLFSIGNPGIHGIFVVKGTFNFKDEKRVYLTDGKGNYVHTVSQELVSHS